MRHDQKGRDAAAQELARKLYRAMPGAVEPTSDGDGRVYWGDVDGSEHFHFCRCIATAIIAVSAATFVEPD